MLTNGAVLQFICTGKFWGVCKSKLCNLGQQLCNYCVECGLHFCLSFFHLTFPAYAFREFSRCRLPNICQICLNSGALGSHEKAPVSPLHPSVFSQARAVFHHWVSRWRKWLSPVSPTAVAQKAVMPKASFLWGGNTDGETSSWGQRMHFPRTNRSQSYAQAWCCKHGQKKGLQL